MSNATAAAPERATKAPSRAKATPSSAPAETPGPTAPDTSSSTEDERLVINTLREQLQQIYDLHWGQIYLYSNELLLAGVEALENVDDSSTALHRAAALTYGALTMQKVERPGSAEISVIEAVFTSLNSAAISYGFSEEGCVALANGIRAGQRQFRDRPAPPIRRVEEPSQSQAGYRHSSRDTRAVFETLATQCEAVRDFSVDIRSRLQSDSSSVVEACNDLTIVQHMIAFMGSMCEEMHGGAGTLIGGPAAWATMDGIEAIGGAA